jgi:ariadne-1
LSKAKIFYSGKWSTHSECNRYENNEAIQTQYALALSRYVHYHDRFRNHEHSFDLETKCFKKLRRKLNRNDEQLSKNDIQIIEKAFDILLDCRQMLIYTYPFAYYLIKNNQSIVFEQNQADLERACEELGEIFQQDLTKEMIVNKMRRKLYEKSQYCHARKNVLLEHVKEGYTNDYWQYQDDAKNNTTNDKL